VDEMGTSPTDAKVRGGGHEGKVGKEEEEK